MSNPTGTVFLQANLNYVWADGDVYEIQQTDEVEGAATNASFAGIGVDNQPHQTLLNKIEYIHLKQLADEQALANLNKSTRLPSQVGINGEITFPVQDSVLGAINILVQWGTYSLLNYPSASSSTLDAILSVAFTTAFAHALWLLLPSWQTTDQSGDLALVQAAWGLQAVTPLPSTPPISGANIAVDWNENGTVLTASSTGRQGIIGISWLAVGY